ncbi:MAG: GDP-mannose 4,6-dehydratase [Proteobacteria bacterium]|nr:GDP-mannose 4,6-dehydratase [Pseudomonadota bacterium]
MSKTAVITGVTGQDGAYLSALLLSKGYRVVGLIRPESRINGAGLVKLGIEDDVEYRECELTDVEQLSLCLQRYTPDEVYNLAALSSVSGSFRSPVETIQFNVNSTLSLLEAIRKSNAQIRLYHASSSEMFGKVDVLPIVENTIVHPLSPYAISKASCHWAVINYREAFDIYSSCGILFNHESYLRSADFFVKKVIVDSIAISRGELSDLQVGNIDIKRDFGWAKEYVKAMWLILQQEAPDDYVICSGHSISLRSIIEHVFNRLNIALDKIQVNSDYFRPTEILDNYGDKQKAVEILGWKYDMNFYEVLDILIEEELSGIAQQ